MINCKSNRIRPTLRSSRLRTQLGWFSPVTAAEPRLVPLSVALHPSPGREKATTPARGTQQDKSKSYRIFFLQITVLYNYEMNLQDLRNTKRWTNAMWHELRWYVKNWSYSKFRHRQSYQLWTSPLPRLEIQSSALAGSISTRTASQCESVHSVHH